MALTIYEYSNTLNGEPVFPPSIRRDAAELSEAHALSPLTEYVAVVSTADAYLRISIDGSAATSDDHKILAGQSYGFLVQPGGGAQLYAIAA